MKITKEEVKEIRDEAAKCFSKRVFDNLVEILEGDALEEKCECKEDSCKKGCSKPHTHKGFFCEVCEPEATSKMNEPQPIEEIEWTLRDENISVADEIIKSKLNEVIKAINKK